MTPAILIAGAIEAGARAKARSYNVDPEARHSLFGAPQYDNLGRELTFWESLVSEVAPVVTSALAYAAIALLLDARDPIEPGMNFEDSLDPPSAATPPQANGNA